MNMYIKETLSSDELKEVLNNNLKNGWDLPEWERLDKDFCAEYYVFQYFGDEIIKCFMYVSSKAHNGRYLFIPIAIQECENNWNEKRQAECINHFVNTMKDSNLKFESLK